MRKALLGVLIALSIMAGFLFLAGLGFFLSYGPATQSSADAIRIEEKGEVISFLPLSVSSRQGIVIYPANLVSPWQYQDSAEALALSGRKVFVVEPDWRLSTTGPKVLADLQEQNAEINRWYLIGNSAGAGLACRDKDANPSIISEAIVVNGYCKGFSFKPQLAIFGSGDWLVRSSAHTSQAQKSEVASGGHFLLTDRKKSQPGHSETVSMILQYLDGQNP